MVKQIIVSTAQNIDAPADQQGAGLLDAYQAVLAAASYRGRASRPGTPCWRAPASSTPSASPAPPSSFTETLTNAGAGSVTVGLSSRTLSPYQPVSTRTLSLTNAGNYATDGPFTVRHGPGPAERVGRAGRAWSSSA